MGSGNEGITQKEGLVVLLFPSSCYTRELDSFCKRIVGKDARISDVFDRVIQERYLSRGFELVTANYCSDAVPSGITLKPKKVIRSNEDMYFFGDSWKKSAIEAEYLRMAKDIEPEKYKTVIVGGFHSEDCVSKFARAINTIAANAQIDTDLTDKIYASFFKCQNSMPVEVNPSFDYAHRDEKAFEEFNLKYAPEGFNGERRTDAPVPVRAVIAEQKAAMATATPKKAYKLQVSELCNTLSESEAAQLLPQINAIIAGMRKKK